MSVTGASPRAQPGNGGSTGKTVSAAGFCRVRAMAERSHNGAFSDRNRLQAPRLSVDNNVR